MLTTKVVDASNGNYVPCADKINHTLVFMSSGDECPAGVPNFALIRILRLSMETAIFTP